MSVTAVHGLPNLDPISPDSDKIKKDNTLTWVRGYFTSDTTNEQIVNWCKRCRNFWYEDQSYENEYPIDIRNLYITHYQTLISILEGSQPP